MKLPLRGYSIITLVLLTGLVISVSWISLSQTQKPLDGPADGVSWKPVKIAVSSVNSKFDLTLPALSKGSDWIIGVSPVKAGENEEIVAGLVSWENTGASKKFNFEKISAITNYPENLCELTQGKFKIGDMDGDAVKAQSLVVFLKISPDTKLNIVKDGTSLANRAVDSGFVVQNDMPMPLKVAGVHTLLTQLQSNRLLKVMQPNRATGGKNE